MENISRRRILLSGGALLGVNALSVLNPLSNPLFAAEIIPRPFELVRADKNENPYGPSRVALQAINEGMDLTNKYGGGSRRKLVELIAKQNGVTSDHIAIGTGSGEILKTGGLIASWEKGSVVCVDPTYQDLVRYASRVGTEIIRVPVDENLACDLNAVAAAIRPDTKMVYLVNPNNPIPNIINKDALRDFVLEVSKDRLVFIDEAYYEFVENPEYGSMIDLIAEGHRNIIVARTASKIHGLAGLAVGFGFAHPDQIKQIRELRTGKNNILGIEAAYASYQDQEFQDYTRRQNKESLKIVEEMFNELNVRFIKSNANFTFFETGIPVQEINTSLLEYGIASGRPFPPFTMWSRVSMDKPEHMRYYVQTFKKLFGNRIMDSTS
ncbi:MAG: histidinol-phosphate aminotransferase [Woeseiaceae bacterium]|jgi:histidinol-phosphate aminotransferase|tara:strand:+ start:81973 stop:83118 length:1146 start_codon:yes stop_codon:yes gene_type:complete